MFSKWISGHLPSQCRVCHAWPAQSVCEACISEFGQPTPRCSTCALPLTGGARQCGTCLKEPPPLARCLAALAYAFPWSDLIQHYKFHNEPGLVRAFAALLRATPWVESTLEQADLLIPLPLSDAKLKARGYNQALLLARQLEPHKSRADLLLKIRDTPAQHTLKRSQRLTALAQAFAVEPLLAQRVKGQRIVLVDDVMTTGATLFTAARVLQAAGAAEVSAVVIARTE